ncbi:DUF4806 domain-containing protein, partial [Aphis craccivora]
MNVSQKKYHLAQAPFNIQKNEKLGINAAAATKPYINYCHLLLLLLFYQNPLTLIIKLF